MKRLQIACSTAMLLFLLTAIQVQAQDESPYIVTFTTSHWNMDYKDYSMDDWKKLESEYHQKVIMKNEYIAGAAVLMHYYTSDNSEIIFVQSYKSWEDVDKASKRNAELAKEAWPNDATRQAFFDKQSAYYSNMHSDEIYSTLPLAKFSEDKPTEPMVCYIRTTHRAWPKDGKTEEIQALRKEYVENVIHKNDLVKAYYPMRHLYGADSRQLVEVFVLSSLADLETTNKTKNEELVKAHWPDEAKEKAFFDAYDKYREPWHGDMIYTSVPELNK